MYLLLAILVTGLPMAAAAQSSRDEASALCLRQDAGITLDQAVSGCDRVIRSGRADPHGVAWAFAWRGTHRLNQGDRAAALADYDEAIRLDPGDPIVYGNRGDLRSAQGDIAGAMADYNEAIRLDPRDAIAYNNRGNLRSGQRDIVGAMADYNEAIRLDPGYSLAYYNRGVLRENQADLAGALADYNEAIRLDPGYAAAYTNRGKVRADQGDDAGALTDYDEAIRLDPREIAAYNNRGNLRRAAGDLAAALADYDAARRIDARHPYPLANLCITRVRQADPGGTADCEAAIAVANDGWPHAARAGIRLLQGNADAAATDLTEALRREPGNGYALQLRALLLARQSRMAAAAADTHAARAIRPRIETEVIEVFSPAIAR